MMRIFSIFLVLLFTGINVADAAKKAPAGQYRNSLRNHDCKPGCYCLGGGNFTWWGDDVKTGCKNRWGKITTSLNSKGVYLCPSGFPESNSGAATKDVCFYWAGSTKVYYRQANCKSGQYLPADSNSCAACPAGYTCSGFSGYPAKTDQGLTPKTFKCSAGQYMPAGMQACAICPVDNYCPGGTFKFNATAAGGKNICPSGTITMDKVGQSSSAACKKAENTCPAGKYLENYTCLSCPAGSSCPGGLAKSRKCPTDYPNSADHTKTEEECYYEVNNVKVKYKWAICRAGQYLPANSNSCAACPAGYTCSGFSGYPAKTAQGLTAISINCQPGKYLAKGTLVCDKTCPVDSYCSGGAVVFNETSDGGISKCPTGKSTDGKSGARGVSECLSASEIIKICSAGTYAELGTECQACSKGYYCTDQNKGKTQCPNGFSDSDIGAKEETQCYFGNKIYYKQVTCPAGQYLPANSNSCAACPTGYVCDTGYTGYPKTVDQGITPKSIQCPAGQYLPANKQTCVACPIDSYCIGGTFSFNPTTANGRTPCPDGKTTYDATGGTNASACITIPTSCPGGQYLADRKCHECPAGHYCIGDTEKIPCPASTPQVWRTPSTYPDTYYANDAENAVQILDSTYIPTWDSLKGKSKISDCVIVYHVKNLRSNSFVDEGVKYNTETGRYDIGGRVYYKNVNPGYYLKERYSDTYCENKDRNMLYNMALLCPPDKWCPGVKQTSCSAGAYEDEMGIAEPVPVQCSAGQYLPANQQYCAPCDTSKYSCPGSESGKPFYTTHRDQGRYIAFTQAQMLYGPRGEKTSDPTDTCWGNLGDIGYKNCVFGQE